MAPVNGQYSQYGNNNYGANNNQNQNGYGANTHNNNNYGQNNDYDQSNDYGRGSSQNGYGYNQNNYQQNQYQQNQHHQQNYGYGQQQHNNGGYGQVPNVDSHSISNHYNGDSGDVNTYDGGDHPSSAAYGDAPDSSRDYDTNNNDDLYANVKDDEQKLNLGDYVTGMDDEIDGGIPGGMMTITVVFSVLCILLCVFGLIALLKKRGPETETYSAAVPDRYFTPDNKEVSCLNCRLIEMGSMACYQELCPQCGRPPPNR